MFGGEVVVNLENAWSIRVTICEFGDVLLRLVPGVQECMAVIFDEIPREDHIASEVVLRAF